MGRPDRSFEAWIDACGFTEYVAMCASGNLGMDAPGIIALRDAFERERLAELVPMWWWQLRRGDLKLP